MTLISVNAGNNKTGLNESTRIFGISLDGSTQPTTAEIYFDDAEQGDNEVSTESAKFDENSALGEIQNY